MITPGDCPHAYTITRTWTATDDCDNLSRCIQTIHVDDTTPPVWNLNCQFDVTFNNVCPDDAEISLNIGDEIDIFTTWTIGPNIIPNVSGCVSDNCTAPEDLIIRVVDKTKTGNSCTATLTITFVAEDECGNIAGGFTCTYYIVDDTPPVAPPAPADLTLECDQPVPPMEPLVAFDECQGEIQSLLASSISQGDCPHAYFIHRTWTFDDGCGNSVTISQNITIDDTTPPVGTSAARACSNTSSVPRMWSSACRWAVS